MIIGLIVCETATEIGACKPLSRLFGERFKMTMKISVENFVAVIQKSGLVDNDRLQRAVEKFSAASSNDASKLADVLVADKLLTQWQADKLLQGKHRGYFLGKYKLLSLLGKGGMSSVYLAEHRLMRRQCALKVLPAKRVDDSSYLERFHREAQAAASLDHPNIVRAYDVDHQDEGNRQIHFLVMEYVEGTSLQEMVPEKGLPSFLDAAEFARQAALGLQHAHEAGMVHRDIKPGNLLVDLNGVVKILDLGLARFFTVDEGREALTLRHDERVLGTADYLAPEQALDSHRVDARADLYSLGCTLYFMITGQPPFTEGTLAQRLLAHQMKTPAAVESIRVDTPMSLVLIVRKLMEKKPDDRFATAAEVEKALFDWVDENADSVWRKAHINVYGSRASESDASLIAMQVGKQTDVPPQNSVGRTSSGGNIAPGSGADASPHGRSTESGHSPATKPASGSSNDTSLNHFLATLAQPQTEATRVKSTTTVEPPPVAPPVVEPEPSTTASRAEALTKIIISPDSPEETAVPNPIAPSRKKVSNESIPVIDSKKEPKGGASPRPAVKKPQPPLMLILGLAVSALLGILGSLSWGRTNSQNSSAASKKSIQSPFPIDKSEVTVGGKSGEYENLRDALIAVRDRYRPVSQAGKTITIKIAAGTYTDRIRIDGRLQTWPEGIKVVGIGEVRLAPPGDDPVLRLANISRFSIENLSIDATDKKVAVEVADDLHESHLSQIVVKGFTEVGILGKGAQGLSFANSQLVMDQIKFEPGNSRASGIRLEGRSDHDANNIMIRHCRFLSPMASGIDILGRSPYGIEITHSIFNETAEGIRFEGEPQLKRIRIANNTFRKTKSGIVFFKLPHELSSEISVRRNLFVDTGIAEALIRSKYDDAKIRTFFSTNPPGAQDNWSDRPKPATSTEGELALLFENRGKRGEKNLGFVSTDPKDPKFLAPTEKSPQADVSGAQASDSKWIGAIGP